MALRQLPVPSHDSALPAATAAATLSGAFQPASVCQPPEAFAAATFESSAAATSQQQDSPRPTTKGSALQHSRGGEGNYIQPISRPVNRPATPRGDFNTSERPATNFSCLRGHWNSRSFPANPGHSDRLLRSLAMEGLVQDFNMALDETAGSQSSERSTGGRRKAWKRRCKSTSNLVMAGQNISDDSSSSLDNVGLLSRDRGTSSLQLSDSDPEGAAVGTGGCIQVVGGGATSNATAGITACSNRRNKPGTTRGQENQRRRVVLDPFTIESDSFTENISPYKEFRCHSKRKRKSKRMAVDQSSENVKPVIQAGFVFRSPGQGTKRKKVRGRSGCDGFLTGKKGTSGITPGKRKRSAREKSVDYHTSDKNKEREDRMECDDVSGSSLSSSEWEDLGSDLSHGDNDGREADDEQSDWPGPEPAAMSVMQLTDEEIDSEVTFNVNTTRKGTLTRRSFTAREIKAGARRLRTQRTIPTVEAGRRLTLSEIIARFIQDPSMNSLCIPLPVRSSEGQDDRILRSQPTEDRGTVLRLASLYSLSWTQEEPNSIVISKNIHVTEPAAEFVVPGIPRPKDHSKKFDPKRQKKLQTSFESSSCRMEGVGMSGASSSSSSRTRKKSGSKSS